MCSQQGNRSDPKNCENNLCKLKLDAAFSMKYFIMIKISDTDEVPLAQLILNKFGAKNSIIDQQY